ncbi:MAG: pirin family protein [Methylococcaceae bacterium]|nr:pirin family protein [Methylococcaceae bacterium]MDZ4155206.1 pirin family protein [Methylococcales bacterium]MDP2393522.1 pirin family protein [Methylococcaceae bacterium]MDP3021393.1 pirin family protein [Methylococcaceae bacterium]MDP3391017.1 pirin family protein [Methylococcaceae bacterium]
MNTTITKTVQHPRNIEQIITGQPVTEGAGVKIIRLVSQPLHRRLDPFLMLDAFRSDDPNDYLAGFPDHPHRGFETVTFMIAGRMRHRDSAGHEGLLQNGGVQWMNAGAGVIHSEMPEQEGGVMEGFQLWLNLSAKDKLSAPWYRDIAAETIPTFETGGVTVNVIAGASHGIEGAVTRPVTEPLYLDLHLEAGSGFEQALPDGYNGFIYVYRGAVSVGDKTVAERQLGILANNAASDGVVLQAEQAARVLLIAGRPLKEPIVQHGPFVMNTEEEIIKAVSDFRHGRLAV